MSKATRIAFFLSILRIAGMRYLFPCEKMPVGLKSKTRMKMTKIVSCLKEGLTTRMPRDSARPMIKPPKKPPKLPIPPRTTTTKAGRMKVYPTEGEA